MKRTIRNSYYAYKLINPITNLPFYVGKGFHARMYSHITEAKKDQSQWINPHKCRTILNILDAGHTIQYEYILCDTEESAIALEHQWIQELGLRHNNTGILTNITEAGCTANPAKVPVDVYSVNGALLHTFESGFEACRQLSVSDPSLIARCIGGDLHSYKGLVFVRKGEPFAYKNTKQKLVVATNALERLTFQGTTAAANWLQRSTSCVRQSCANNWSIKGYKMSYE